MYSMSRIPKHSDFNPRSHEGSDGRSGTVRTVPEGFQSTLPRGERLNCGGVVVSMMLFQSTLPRGERRTDDILQREQQEFQSTLPRGERPGAAVPIRSGMDFNPRSHEGSDIADYNDLLSGKISIHAPTRGATFYQVGEERTTQFQSTLPRGERPLDWLDLVPKTVFQSTLPRGERPPGLVSAPFFSQFQSTLPRGERPSLRLRISVITLISIHAPTRGATKCQQGGAFWTRYFNPRSHEGSDASRSPQRRETCDFNPRSHEGSDR